MTTGRRAILAAAVVAAVTLAWVITVADDQVASPIVTAIERSVRQVSAGPTQEQSSPAASVSSTRERISNEEVIEIDAFKVVSFLPPPAPVQEARAVIPPRPVSPPFPFRFFGRITEGAGESIYLMQDDRLIPVSPSQILDNVYRVDVVNATEVRITFLPLNEQTILTLPGSD